MNGNQIKITKRQKEVLFWVQKASTNKQIAKRLNISESTVKLHIGKLLKAYGVQNKLQLGLYSQQGKVAQLPDVTDAEPKPVGWILRHGKVVRGFVTNEPPSEKWEPVYVIRARGEKP